MRQVGLGADLISPSRALGNPLRHGGFVARGALVADLLHQSAGAAQTGDQAEDLYGGCLSRPTFGDAPGGISTDGNRRRVASHPPLLQLRIDAEVDAPRASACV